MPKATSRSFKQLRSRVVFPKRVSDDERRKKYKREVLGGPGPVDCWLCSASAVACDCTDRPPTADEVWCTIRVIREPPPPADGPFVDPETYTIHLSVTLNSTDVTTSVVLQTYRGSSDSLDAPDWTRCRPGKDLVFLQTKVELAELLKRVATYPADARKLSRRLEMLTL